MKKILVIGSTNVDMTLRTNLFPNRGETVMAESFKMTLGGKGANQAVAASMSGGDVNFLTCLGNDSNKDFVLNELNKYKVNVVPIIKNASTGSAIVIVESSTSENEIIVNGGSNVLFTKKDIDDNIDLIKNTDYILLQLEIPYEIVEYIVKLADMFDKKIILNPAPFNKVKGKILQGITYITPNEGELKLLANNYSNDYLENATALVKKGIPNIIVTLGKNGSSLINSNGEIKIKSYKVNAKDTTGAGDCYNGVFVSYLSQGYSLEESLNYASIASAISVTKEGTVASYPTKEEIEDYKNNN